MGLRRMTEGLHPYHGQRGRVYRSSARPDLTSHGKRSRTLLRQFMSNLDRMETLTRGLHPGGSDSIASALMSRVNEMRAWIETAMAAPRRDPLLHGTLLSCTAESEQIVNLLECANSIPPAA